MSRLTEFVERLTSRRAKVAYTAVAVLVAAIVAFGLSVLYNGVVATMVYSVVFVVTLTAIPTAIGVLGEAVPGNGLLAKLQITLGALAYNHHYLVQREDCWEWQPGDDSHVYIDGELREIDGGFENKSVLGWRPFGILRYKEDDSLEQVRVDEQATILADGVGTFERETYGNYETKHPGEIEADGWLVDLKRVYTHGVRKIGDIELIETAEEIIERGQVDDSAITGWRPVIGSLVGLAMGAILAYVLTAGG